MKILFLHGWQSTPGGVKPTFLAQHGHTVLNPKLPDDDFDAALAIAQTEYDKHQPDVIVGSSRGGALAMCLQAGDTPLVLLCPAWKKYGTAKTIKANSTILHSGSDDVVLFADSQELATNSGATLIEVGSDHRLADPESLTKMLEVCEQNSRHNSLREFDLFATFKSENCERDKFLSRLFGMFSEHPVRFWGGMESSPYEFIGRPTVFHKSEPGKRATLDFALRRREDGRCFVAEMKCELEYCNYRYLTLVSPDQVERHRREQLQQGKRAFAWFLDAAKSPESFLCKTGSGKVSVELSGAILIWGRFTPEGRDAAMREFGFADVLSAESIVNDLIRTGNEPYRRYLQERLSWCEELFLALLGKQV